MRWSETKTNGFEKSKHLSGNQHWVHHVFWRVIVRLERTGCSGRREQYQRARLQAQKQRPKVKLAAAASWKDLAVQEKFQVKAALWRESASPNYQFHGRGFHHLKFSDSRSTNSWVKPPQIIVLLGWCWVCRISVCIAGYLSLMKNKYLKLSVHGDEKLMLVGLK